MIMRRKNARRAAAALLLLLATTGTANAGPPWISIEYPSNPHHASTRDAALLVHAYHHSMGISTAIEGFAIGVVDGKRVRMTLDVRETALPGVYALRTPLPKNGTWVLSLTMRDGTAPATALVTVDRRGTIAGVTVPSDRSKDGWVVPRAATSKDIESALQAGLVADAAAGRADVAKRAAFGLPIGLMVAAAALRRRRVAA